MVLIDSSGSVGYENFRKIKDYLRDFVSKMNIGADRTRVGVATFSHFSRAEIYLDSYYSKRDLMNAISGLAYEYGNTNTASGIKLVRSAMFSNRHGDRPDVPNFGESLEYRFIALFCFLLLFLWGGGVVLFLCCFNCCFWGAVGFLCKWVNLIVEEIKLKIKKASRQMINAFEFIGWFKFK